MCRGAPGRMVVVGEEVEMFVGDVLGLVRGEAFGHLVFETGVLGHELGFPPSRMSVPRPAMLVETVTAFLRPAWATMDASRS